MSNFVNRIAAIAALALAATPIIGLSSAHAGQWKRPIARIVVGDLRLAHPADAREFQRRVDRAAAQVCHATGVRGMSYRACLMDFDQDLRAEMTPTQISDLRTALRAEPTLFASRDF